MRRCVVYGDDARSRCIGFQWMLDMLQMHLDNVRFHEASSSSTPSIYCVIGNGSPLVSQQHNAASFLGIRVALSSLLQVLCCECEHSPL